MKPFIYLASPYTRGDACINTHFQMKMFARFVKDGVVNAYIPLWSHFQHSAFPEPYQTWIQYDLAIIPRLDGVIRLNADLPEFGHFVSESSGADGEAKFAAENGLPVWYSLVELYQWAALRAAVLLTQAEADRDGSMQSAVDVGNAREYLEVCEAALARGAMEADERMCVGLSK